MTEQNSQSEGSLEKRIQKNNEVMEQWEKTNETRDRLKLLKMAANAEDDTK
jgi:hypothetical protein